MLLRRKVISVLLVGVVATSVWTLRFLIKGSVEIAKSRTKIMDILDNIEAEKDEKYSLLPPVEKLYRLYDGVETFVLFIGYPRSSHSLVGAILDAHPEIIIPHEFNLLGKWKKLQSQTASKKHMKKYSLFLKLQQLSTKQAMFGIRANKNDTLLTGDYTYTYNVPGLWQGGYQHRIKVIGDKKGGRSSMILANQGQMKTLEEIAEVVQVPMKFIHVTRNPFDNIATMMLRSSGRRDAVRKDNTKVNDTKRLDWFINIYFKLATANQRVRECYRDALIDIPGHETVLRPRETIQKLCDHLGVTCSDDYLDKCSSIMYGAPSVTRDKVVWTEEQKMRVTQEMQSYPFLKDYSFDVYPEQLILTL